MGGVCHVQSDHIRISQQLHDPYFAVQVTEFNFIQLGFFDDFNGNVILCDCMLMECEGGRTGEEIMRRGVGRVS